MMMMWRVRWLVVLAGMVGVFALVSGVASAGDGDPSEPVCPAGFDHIVNANGHDMCINQDSSEPRSPKSAWKDHAGGVGAPPAVPGTITPPDEPDPPRVAKHTFGNYTPTPPRKYPHVKRPWTDTDGHIDTNWDPPGITNYQHMGLTWRGVVKTCETTKSIHTCNQAHDNWKKNYCKTMVAGRCQP